MGAVLVVYNFPYIHPRCVANAAPLILTSAVETELYNLSIVQLN